MSTRTKKILAMCNTNLEIQSCSKPKTESCDSKKVIVEPLPPMTQKDFEVVLENSEFVFLDIEEKENFLPEGVNIGINVNARRDFDIVYNPNDVEREVLSTVTTKAYISEIGQELVHQPEIAEKNKFRCLDVFQDKNNQGRADEYEPRSKDEEQNKAETGNNYQPVNYKNENYQARTDDYESDKEIEEQHYRTESENNYQPESDDDESNEENSSEEPNLREDTSEDDYNVTSEKPEEQSDVGRGTKRKLHQKRRLLGKTYLGYRRPKNQNLTFQDTERNARVMGPTCSSQACKRSARRWCQDISEIEREQIFKTFWENLNSWEQKKVYVSNLVYRKQTERKRTPNETSRRSSSLFYKLNIGSKHIPVCKKMFLNTLGLKEWTVQTWVNNSTYGTHGALTSRTSQPRYKNEESIQFLTTFLDNLPKLPSHYCRKDTNKLYLEQTFTSFADLFKLYQEHCKISQKQALSRNTLMKYVKTKNIGIFSPRKDQCDLCVEYQAGNLDHSVWEKHRNEKQRAQEEKNNDKEHAKLDKCHVICVDLQAVKTCPSLQASSLYFKTKLCCHNYTVFDLKTKDVICYWFDETDTDLQASTFASLLVDFLKRKYLENNNTNQQKPIIIFSDGCTYQNRNATLANALLTLSYQYDVTIIQKFLIKGHTNMECDSVHATIEKKLKNKTISIPNDYHRITAEARGNPKPFEVVCPTFEFFYNFNVDLVYESIRPGKKPEEPTVTDIRVLKYEKGEIQYKLNFEDNFFTTLPQRPKKAIKKIEEFPKLHTGKLLITPKKYNHLQEIKTKLHQNYWPFYDNLLYK